MNYEQRLINAGARLLEPLRGTKEKHNMLCLKCNHQWHVTPLAVTQAFRKFQSNSCPKCNDRLLESKRSVLRQANIQTIKDRGFEILSDWDGRRVNGKSNDFTYVTLRNSSCGHEFTSQIRNVLSRGVECPTCAKMYKTNNLNASSERRSAVWRQTASAWRIYKSRVTSLTRVSYRQNKHIINPDDLPLGIAGVEGAYHLDHKVSIRYCFDNDIPAEWCAQASNLQMLPWLENIRKRDKVEVLLLSNV